VRVVALESSREAADREFPGIENKHQRQLHAYKELTDDQLFKIQRVKVELPVEDKPGRPVSRISCQACGEGVNDHREVLSEGRVLCRACAGQAYYREM
jgi:formylmethanofuran dehydrogenase subunit E